MLNLCPPHSPAPASCLSVYLPPSTCRLPMLMCHPCHLMPHPSHPTHPTGRIPCTLQLHPMLLPIVSPEVRLIYWQNNLDSSSSTTAMKLLDSHLCIKIVSLLLKHVPSVDAEPLFSVMFPTALMQKSQQRETSSIRRVCMKMCGSLKPMLRKWLLVM